MRARRRAGEAAPASLVVSDEHLSLAFVDVDTLAPAQLPAVYRRLIARSRAGAQLA